MDKCNPLVEPVCDKCNSNEFFFRRLEEVGNYQSCYFASPQVIIVFCTNCGHIAGITYAARM